MPDVSAAILTVLSLLSTVAIAAVPWAYKVGSRLTRIETMLASSEMCPNRTAAIEKCVSEHEFRIKALERVE